VADEGSTVVQDECEEGKRESDVLGDVLPPSPPLTPVGTNESLEQTRLDREEGGGGEMDIVEVEWHPLGHAQTASVDNQTQDAVVSQESDIVTSDGHLAFPEDEKVKLSSPRRASELQPLDTKPPSPQPWDLVDPPPSNGRRGTDYYSTLGPRKFDTLQTQGPVPKSSYYFGPPPPGSAYGTHPIGQIGAHHPREILRVERDYTGGELVQFAPIYPLELEGRITPTQFLESINAINEVLISAHSLRHTVFDNVLTVFSLQLSRLWVTSHYEKEMRRLQLVFDELNARVYNPVGLNIIWPRKVAFLFLEIEYY
jgi:hypothetical protein